MTDQKIITFFIDRCLGSKCIPDKLIEKGISVEIHDNHFAKDAKDTEWLPIVGNNKWVILTKDTRIGKNTLEKIAVASAKIKMFTFASQDIRGEEMAEILLKSITKIQEFVRKNDAPFIAKIYRDAKLKMWKDHITLNNELNSYLNSD